MKNTIGITMGDPRGVGPEIVAKAWGRLNERERSHLVIYGDRMALQTAAENAKVEFDHKRIITTSSTTPPIQKIEEAEAARLAISAIDAALADVASGKLAGIVTAPVSKRRIQLVSPGFMGHTEYLSKAARVRDTVMMFASADSLVSDEGEAPMKQLCFSLVTMHLPIRDVAAAIKTERVLTTIRQTHLAMDKHFACPYPRIAVMSLNPHGGEGGVLGTEEKTAIKPAIERAIKEGINCIGPMPADSLFQNLEDFDYDAVVAMYHDQGLLPVKLICKKKSVNITLGLPYIRTSPAHGTAEDIAWMGTADETSMLCAIRLARKLVGW
ncbi:MAG: 4-hydroxythreonine-4-phosphate dehydrogenase PdxA, partial [Pseudomonadota bacterium]